MSDGGDAQRIKPDPLRLLATRSEIGYTDRLDRAMRDEPEAVSHDEQTRLTEIARRREHQRRLDAYRSMRAVVLPALDSFVDCVGPLGGVGSTVRAARRSIEQLARRV